MGGEGAVTGARSSGIPASAPSLARGFGAHLGVVRPLPAPSRYRPGRRGLGRARVSPRVGGREGEGLRAGLGEGGGGSGHCGGGGPSPSPLDSGPTAGSGSLSTSERAKRRGRGTSGRVGVRAVDGVGVGLAGIPDCRGPPGGQGRIAPERPQVGGLRRRSLQVSPSGGEGRSRRVRGPLGVRRTSPSGLGSQKPRTPDARRPRPSSRAQHPSWRGGAAADHAPSR